MTIDPVSRAQADALLPCGRECFDSLEGFTHVNCCAGYRPATAAALSELRAERGKLRAYVSELRCALTATRQLRDEQIAKLEAENARLRDVLETKGIADAYRDGFAAAVETARSVRILIHGQNVPVSKEEVVSTLEGGLARLLVRATLAPSEPARFAKLSGEPPAILPPDYSAPLDSRSLDALIAEAEFGAGDLKDAFVAGCCAVLTWTHSGMPQDDLDEAGYDYVATRRATLAIAPLPSAPPDNSGVDDYQPHPLKGDFYDV